MHADGYFLVTDDGKRIGPFSSHWAACAAMIRCSNPGFKSLGGDCESDLEIERKVISDAYSHGIGFSRILPDGSVEHLPYESVVAPKD